MLKKIFFSLIVIIAGVGIVLFAILFYVNVFLKTAPNFENRKFANLLHTIEKGQNFNQIARDLKEKDLIASRFWFDSYFFLSGKWSRIKAGTYDLPYGSTTAQLAGIISRGEVKTEKIAILEGWNLKNIAEYCEDKDYFTQKEFFEVVNNSNLNILSWLGVPKEPGTSSEAVSSINFFQKVIDDFYFFKQNNSTSSKPSSSLAVTNLEGYLFPDTYEIDYPITPEKIIKMALANFEIKVFSKIQQDNFKEVLIMASLLEKEVRSYEDKQIVAGILWKRIKEEWPLQVDSTINYALGDFGAKLSLDDLQFESAYNTYRNKGLPPTPICNPGLESIQAAIDYTESPYWYYLSTKNGTTIFSKTFEQHKIAKARYLR